MLSEHLLCCAYVNIMKIKYCQTDINRSLASPQISPKFYLYSVLFYPIISEGRRGFTDKFATTPFHLVQFSAALAELAKSTSVL